MTKKVFLTLLLLIPTLHAGVIYFPVNILAPPVSEIFNLSWSSKAFVLSPDIVDKVVREKMHLGDVKEVKKLLEKRLTRTSYRRMINSVGEAIRRFHPSYEHFLKPLFYHMEDELRNTKAQEFFHHLAILHLLVEKMNEDVEFENVLMKALYNERTKRGFNQGSVPDSFRLMRKLSFFEWVKMMTMDSAMNYYNKIANQGHNDEQTFAASMPINGVVLNIFEALATDFFAGNIDNSVVGWKLMQTTPTDQCLSESRPAYLIVPNETRAWISLYDAWNFAFVMKHLDNMDLVLPKLFLRAVLAPKLGNWKRNRCKSLWLTIQFYILAILDNKSHKTSPEVKKLALKLAKITRENLANGHICHWGAPAREEKQHQ